MQTRNLKLCALTWGDDSMHPVIALHGWLDNAASFIPLGERLRNMYLVALDLPGHGKSEHRQGINAYYVTDYATDVLLAIEELGFKRVSLLGHSLGGIIGALLAAGVPDRVNRLGLIDGMGPMTEDVGRFPNRLKKHFSYAVRQSRGLKTFKTKAEASKARFDAADIGELLFQSAELIAYRNLVATDGGFKWRTDPKLLCPSPFYWTEEYALEMLEQIQCETRLILPDSGILNSRIPNRVRETKVRDLEIVELSGRHHVHMDDPVPVAASLQPFFDRQCRFG